MSAVVHLGDCLEIMRGMADNSVDSIVTDPPYGLSKQPDMTEVLRHWLANEDYVHKGGGFMGKAWDSFVPGPAIWREALRVLKPGGHLLSFFGSRTYDIGTLAIRLAGFHVIDQIMWVTGQGFPKSHNLTGEHKGFGTALKPSVEPLVLARKPLIGTVAQNVLAHGTGALNIDGCRIESGSDYHDLMVTQGGRKGGGFDVGVSDDTRHSTFTPSSGRWPANFIHDGSDEVLALFPETKNGGENSKAPERETSFGKRMALTGGSMFVGDSGSAARFFYCSKASRSDRGEGNTHATVKPTDLMRYLVRLITPPMGTVLDPFCGSGSTLKAAILEGFNCIGIELDAEYVQIARDRIANAQPALLGAS